MWLGDFEHGPVIVQQGHAIKTHLSAWIDCRSRYIIEARYYVHENLDILIDSLLRAWGAHGASAELYLDNAKIYHADGLKLACTQLNIRLLHRPPRQPQPGGLIERFFQTLQEQFEAEVRAAPPLSLGTGKRYERERGAHLQPKPPGASGPIGPHYLRALQTQQEEEHAAKRQQGLDFHSAEKRNTWSFSSFARNLAQLVGRSGGLSAMTADELDRLRSFHATHDRVTESLLGQAVAQADEKSIPQILWQLQILLRQSEE